MIRFNRWCADPLNLLQCTHITVKVKNPIQPMHQSTAGQLSADVLATIYPSNLQDASGVCAFKNSSFRSHHIFKSQWSIKTFLLPNLANKLKVNMSVRSVSADMLTSLVKYPKKAKKKCREDLGHAVCRWCVGQHISGIGFFTFTYITVPLS